MDESAGFGALSTEFPEEPDVVDAAGELPSALPVVGLAATVEALGVRAGDGFDEAGGD